jgi:ferredoxin
MFLIHPPKEEHAREAFVNRVDKAGERGTDYIYDPIDSEKMRELLLDYERRLGLVHTVFTIGFPSVITVCNCEMPYCHSLRQRFMYGVRESFLEGHYVASVSNDKCVGCGKCPEQCQFGAIHLDRKLGKVWTMPTLCMGCGICRSVCPTAAIEMRERADVTLLPAAEPVGLLQESAT